MNPDLIVEVGAGGTAGISKKCHRVAAVQIVHHGPQLLLALALRPPQKKVEDRDHRHCQGQRLEHRIVHIHIAETFGANAGGL